MAAPDHLGRARGGFPIWLNVTDQGRAASYGGRVRDHSTVEGGSGREPGG